MASKIQNLLTMMEIALLLNFVGYLFELKADNLNDALIAVKISYLGKPFIVLCMFLFVLEYCNVTLPKWMEFLIILYQASLTVMVHTCEHHRLFYNSISFTEEGMFPHIVFGHGFFYNLYTGVLVLYCIVILSICIRKYRVIESKNEKIQIYLILLMMFFAASTLLLFFSGVCQGYDCTLFGYLFATLCQLELMFRYHLFDTITLAKEQALDSLRDGIVVFNNSDMILYLNQQAKTLIPETEQKANVMKKDILRRKAYVDVNTGAKNRTCFEEDIKKLDEMLKEDDNNDLKIGVIVCDLNGLKHTNDTLGHAVGDRMIETAAKIMQQEMSGAKDVYRTGGDEFVALYIGEAVSHMQEDISKVERVCEEESKKYSFPLSIAMGYALNKQGETLQEIHKRADDAMYERKIELKKENPSLVR